MLFFNVGTDAKKTQVFTKRGNTWQQVAHDSVWGKIDGVWHRGTVDEVVMLLDPATPTVYWNLNLWEMLGHPTNALKVRILVGKNAIIAGGLHPMDPAAALELSGPWNLLTRFQVDLAGIIVGASGWPGESSVPRPDQVNTTALRTAQNYVAGVDIGPAGTAVGTPATARVGQEYSEDTADALGWSSWDKVLRQTGDMWGAVYAPKKGGKGGAAIRANRVTEVNIIETADSIGALLGGGGGGASLSTFWKTYKGNRRGQHFQRPNSGAVVGTLSTFSTAMAKLWSMSGWGGSMGCGANVKAGGFGLFTFNNPASAYAIDTTLDMDPMSTRSLDLNRCHAQGRAVPPMNRGDVGTGAYYDGYGGSWAANIYRHYAKNLTTRRASSGLAHGGDLYMATIAAMTTAKRALAEDLISVGTKGHALAPRTLPLSPLATGDAARISRLIDYFWQPGARYLQFYDRYLNLGGSLVGTPVKINGYWSMDDDRLAGYEIVAGTGGRPGQPGGACSVRSWLPTTTGGQSTIAPGQQALNRADPDGYSFVVLPDTDLGGQGGDAGPAVIGSEYVTINGRRIDDSLTYVSNIAGPIVPFA